MIILSVRDHEQVVLGTPIKYDIPLYSPFIKSIKVCTIDYHHHYYYYYYYYYQRCCGDFRR